MSERDMAVRRVIRYFNVYWWVPIFRMGLASLMVNPFSGYIAVLKTVGHKSGRLRYTPVNYAILDGCIFCMAGSGKAAHWFRNLEAHPDIEVMLPGRTMAGTAEEVSDPAEVLRISRRILVNGGFAGFLFGINPFTVTDGILRVKIRDIPVIRIRPTGVGNGASDPGGWMWIFSMVASILLLVGIARKRRPMRE